MKKLIAQPIISWLKPNEAELDEFQISMGVQPCPENSFGCIRMGFSEDFKMELAGWVGGFICEQQRLDANSFRQPGHFIVTKLLYLSDLSNSALGHRTDLNKEDIVGRKYLDFQLVAAREFLKQSGKDPAQFVVAAELYTRIHPHPIPPHYDVITDKRIRSGQAMTKNQRASERTLVADHLDKLSDYSMVTVLGDLEQKYLGRFDFGSDSHRGYLFSLEHNYEAWQSVVFKNNLGKHSVDFPKASGNEVFVRAISVLMMREKPEFRMR